MRLMVPRNILSVYALTFLLQWLIISSDIDTRLHALPVVDAKHGNLVGIVTAKDVMRDVIRMASKALPSEEKFSQKMMSDIPDLAA